MTPKIINVINSPRKGKKYRAIFEDGNYIDFGSDVSHTYIDHHDDKKKHNYWARHLGNEKERQLITKLIVSPATLSAFILWNKPDLQDSIDDLNHRWYIHGGSI